jgi:hypothetical protein
MNPAKVLSELIAKEFLKDPASVDLNIFEDIEEAAAAKLYKFPKDLHLNGIKAISVVAAENLRRHKGGGLFLNGLGRLSPQAAESLRKHPKLFTSKSLDELMNVVRRENLSQALDEIESYGIMLHSSVPRKLADWPCDLELLDDDVFFNVLGIMAAEGRVSHDSLPVGSRGFYLDFEGVYGDGSYSLIVEGFAFISGQSYRLSDIEDYVDVDAREVWVKFKLDDRLVALYPKINRDWICPETVSKISKLLKPKGAKFFAINLGQSLAFYCFPTRIAKKIVKKIQQDRSEVEVWD